jgi:DNA-binding NarL/FixJ family response regulator
MMPRMNGVQLARAFAAARPDARVLYTTGFAEVPPVPAAIVVHKPFSVAVLMGAVRSTLEAASHVDDATSPA